MSKTLLWILFIVLAVAGYVVYRQRADRPQLNVEPHAAKEIEKARRR